MCEYFVKVLQRTLLTPSQTDVKPFIYMHSKWLENETELQLYLTTNNTCYKATLKHDEIKSAAEELEQSSYEDFFDECKEALTTHMGLLGFDYELDDEQSQFKLWKCTGFETMYVEVSVRKVNHIQQLLDAAIEWGQQQTSAVPVAVTVSKSQSQSGAKDYDQLVVEYEKYIDASKKQEQTLLKKFLLLLNSKKEKIVELQQQQEERRKPAARKIARIDSDETDMDTDPEDFHPNAVNSDDEDFEAQTQELTEKEAITK